ncbi:MauE/DoxX family redox-associated membrane protein [Micromonospora okii]|uniref:MauE/DoxX family redox-associated membrane protein n=1 Tax=Micromonospora okii TaxID=1182970 RepID=UPI001E28C41D|nr:MauE/DoxX family redox-associated membrane protein [Micromonospora okii]
MWDVVIAVEALLCVVFGCAAVAKLRSREALAVFVRALSDLRILPRRAVRPVATLVAVGEAAVAAGLLVACLAAFGLPMRFDARIPAALGLLTGAALLGGFTGTIVIALRRGIRKPCPCFGRAARPLGVRHVVRNLLLLCAALGGAAACALLAPPAALPAPEALTAVLAGAVCACPFVYVDDIVELFAPETTESIVQNRN